MTAALIAIGVIAFLALDAYILIRVFRSRASADEYGSFPVPGETAVTVPAGKLKLTYQESYVAPSSGDSVDFGTPAALDVEVTSPNGERLELKGPGFRGMGASVATGRFSASPANRPRTSGRGWSRSLIGTVQVPAPGTYTITAGPELEGAVEPQILVGR